MNLEQQGVLQNQRTVVGKEDDTVDGGLDIAEYHAVVWIDDVGQSLAGHHALVGGGKTDFVIVSLLSISGSLYK